MEKLSFHYSALWDHAREMALKEPGVEVTDLWPEHNKFAVIRFTPKLESREDWEKRMEKEYGPVNRLDLSGEMPLIPAH